ncbi:MAG: chromatin protein Cren7 [Desulfurococcaceae archaeon]
MSGKQPQRCSRCGSTNTEITRTWHLTAPIPDSMGRITVTVMGAVRCKDCGYSWKAVISKIKVGGKSVEIEGKKVLEEEKEERRVKEIVLDLSEILSEKDK